MSQINHNISAPNDGLGDQLRTAFGHQNEMNTELYATKVEKITGKDLSANDFTNEDKEKLDNLNLIGEANVQPDWDQADTTQADYIKNKPVEMFSSVGSFHYVDLATQSIPLIVSEGVEKKITNDTLDDTTNVLNAPYGVTSMWDTVLNQLDFSQTSIGDLITIIPAIEITTSVANQEFQIYIKLGIESDFPVTKQVYNGSLKVAGSIKVNPTRDFSIDTLDIKDYPGEIFVLSDANCTVKSGELDIKVVRKDINIVADHTHTNLSVLNAITSIVVSSWNSSISWITTNGANLIAHLTNYANPHNVTKAQVGLGNASNTSDANKPVSIATQTALNLKLNTADYNQHFKGVYLTFAALVAANPTGEAGDYAQVNVVGATDVLNYNWDVEESVWIPNAVGGSGATNTDELPEGTSNLYFTVARWLANLTKANIEAKLIGEITSHTHPAGVGVLATVLTGISFLTGTAVVATDTILIGFGKLQKQISDLVTTVNGKQATLVSATNIKTINGESVLGSGDLIVGGSSTLGIVTVPATTYQFLLTDVAKKVIFTSATAVTATIPTNATVDIPIGSKIEVTQSGAGVVTLVTTGLTVISASPLTLIIGQTVILVKTAIDTWTIDGSTTTDDMFMSTIQNVSGLKTFLAGKFGLRNVANTFTSFFTNANTAARTYTLPNKDGTVAMTSDIIAQMSGVVNYLVKFGTATTGVVSRLWDTGTYLGIGTVNSPLKDITLGNQYNREIGIELSNSTTVGRDLIISAGKTINYQLNTAFLRTYEVSRDWYDMATTPSGDILAVTQGGNLYKQTGGVGAFVSQVNNPGGTPQGITVAPNGDVYVCQYIGDIQKQTGGVGSFVGLGQGARNWQGIEANTNGDIYAVAQGDGIYMQTGGAGNFVTLGQSVLAWTAICYSNGHMFAYATGIIYKQTNSIGNFNVFQSTVVAVVRGMCGSTVNNNIYAFGSGQDIYFSNGGAAFIALNQGIKQYRGGTIKNSGDVYACVFNEDIYLQNNDSIGAINLDGGTLINKAGTGKGTGKSRYQIVTGQKTVSGTDMQLETVRAEFDEDGNYKRIGTPVYADNASALAGGLTAGMEYRTATGIKMEVY